VGRVGRSGETKINEIISCLLREIRYSVDMINSNINTATDTAPATDLAPLQAHLDAIEAKTRAWVAEDPATRWACWPVADAAVWAKDGITTVAQFRHKALVTEVCEQIKDLHHCRPDFERINEMSDAELEAMAQRLGQECERQIEEENREEASRVAEEVAAKAREASFLTGERRSGFTIGELVRNLA
jgi:hypothetical protein